MISNKSSLKKNPRSTRVHLPQFIQTTLIKTQTICKRNVIGTSYPKETLSFSNTSRDSFLIWHLQYFDFNLFSLEVFPFLLFLFELELSVHTWNYLNSHANVGKYNMCFKYHHDSLIIFIIFFSSFIFRFLYLAWLVGAIMELFMRTIRIYSHFSMLY